ncbi:MAG TPA: hypothetical protein ENK02_10975 [Planctomycetes bacterium]|nr:hypothetical protein [Planctomycetota bacterium]
MSKLRVRHGENEIEIDGSDQFIKKQLEAFYARIGPVAAITSPATIKQQLLDEPSGPKKGKAPTPAEFYKSKGKKDGLSQLLIFARYLEEFEGKAEFTPGDINKLVKDAKLSKDIHPQYFSNGVKQGLLRKHGRKYSLTLSAEEVLASM